MNTSGQVLIEYVLLMVIFLLLIAKMTSYFRLTFSGASPYLGAKIERRLETGAGFSQNTGFWRNPVSPKGGVKEKGGP